MPECRKKSMKRKEQHTERDVSICWCHLLHLTASQKGLNLLGRRGACSERGDEEAGRRGG